MISFIKKWQSVFLSVVGVLCALFFSVAVAASDSFRSVVLMAFFFYGLFFLFHMAYENDKERQNDG